MKKIIHRPEYSIGGKDHHVGYLPDYKWISMGWHYPYAPGKYLVIDHYGKLKELYCTGMVDIDDRPSIFDQAANNYGESYIDDRKMTDSDLMNLYRDPAYVWYYYEERQDHEDWCNDLYIVTPDNPSFPLYYLDLELNNTKFEINSEGEFVDGKDIVLADINGELINERPREVEALLSNLFGLTGEELWKEVARVRARTIFKRQQEELERLKKEDSDAEKLS